MEKAKSDRGESQVGGSCQAAATPALLRSFLDGQDPFRGSKRDSPICSKAYLPLSFSALSLLFLASFIWMIFLSLFPREEAHRSPPACGCTGRCCIFLAPPPSLPSASFITIISVLFFDSTGHG